MQAYWLDTHNPLSIAVSRFRGCFHWRLHLKTDCNHRDTISPPPPFGRLLRTMSRGSSNGRSLPKPTYPRTIFKEGMVTGPKHLLLSLSNVGIRLQLNQTADHSSVQKPRALKLSCCCLAPAARGRNNQ